MNTKRLLALGLAIGLGLSGGALAQERADIAVVLDVRKEVADALRDGLEAQAAEQGTTVDFFAPRTDVALQALVEDLLAKGYAALALASQDEDALGASLEKAKAAGVPVCVVGEQPQLAALKAAQGALWGITTDEAEVGRLIGEDLVRRLPKGGQIVILEGCADDACCRDRILGLRSALSAQSRIEVVESSNADGKRIRAFDFATNYIIEYVNLRAIVCASDEMALGAQDAVDNNELGTWVYGTEGSREARISVRAKGLTATVARDYEQAGRRALELLANLLAGKLGESAVPRIEFLAAKLIDE